jgi:8-oxo-dGTP diphosphatase
MKHVVIGIIYQNHHLCVAKRLSEPFLGYIECPGGKVEENESFDDALKRELYEEVNLSHFDYNFLRTINVSNSLGEFSLHFYKIIPHDNLHPKVYTELLWIHRDHIHELNWIPHNIPYIDFFKQVDLL